MNDMYKRMGDLRIGAESGLWARVYGGRISYDANNAYMKNSYWAAQVGMDKRLASGWHVGGAFGYNDGSATYRYGGKVIRNCTHWQPTQPGCRKTDSMWMSLLRWENFPISSLPTISTMHRHSEIM